MLDDLHSLDAYLDFFPFSLKAGMNGETRKYLSQNVMKGILDASATFRKLFPFFT